MCFRNSANASKFIYKVVTQLGDKINTEVSFKEKVLKRKKVAQFIKDLTNKTDAN